MHRYFQIHFHLAGLLLRRIGAVRKTILHQARLEYEQYLKLIDSYDILSPSDARIYQRYLADPDNFSTTSAPDAAARRHVKITRFKEERDLKQKLDVRLHSIRGEAGFEVLTNSRSILGGIQRLSRTTKALYGNCTLPILHYAHIKLSTS